MVSTHAPSFCTQQAAFSASGVVPKLVGVIAADEDVAIVADESSSGGSAAATIVAALGALSALTWHSPENQVGTTAGGRAPPSGHLRLLVHYV